MNHLTDVPPPCRKEKKFRVADTSQTAFIGKTFVLHTVEFTTAAHILLEFREYPARFISTHLLWSILH